MRFTYRQYFVLQKDLVKSVKKYRDEFPSSRLAGDWVKQFFFISRTTTTGLKLVQTDSSRLTNKDFAIIRLLIAKRKIPDTVGYFEGILKVTSFYPLLQFFFFVCFYI